MKIDADENELLESVERAESTRLPNAAGSPTKSACAMLFASQPRRVPWRRRRRSKKPPPCVVSFHFLTNEMKKRGECAQECAQNSVPKRAFATTSQLIPVACT